ncbi:MAG: phosphoribosylanthranilate isomerase [Candidatus Bipolaricaulota bacterium]|nr:phosphoribosylanthranilate isomerase [Candidatus Bipolaricaulota bacterium]MBS3792299.1 phosphoribosylanthranilate isomerase [Candidatus Bipolaricaulota bacterium]
MVKVKICGNQTSDDLKVTAKADAVGFIVATPESPRNIEPKTASRLVKETPPFTSTVMVTTVVEPKVLCELVVKVEPDYLQLHSTLTLSRTKEIARSMPNATGIIALITVKENLDDLKNRALKLANSPVDALLLDSKSEGRTGGTGHVHDWNISRTIRDTVHPAPVILAGGLDPENVGKAICKVRPYAVDVATGVEKDEDKSDQKVERFMEEVNDSEVKSVP